MSTSGGTMLFRVIVAVMLTQIVALAGCGIFVQPTTPNDINAYNNQMFQLLMPVVTAVVTLLGFVGLWVQSARAKSDLAQKTENAARDLADASAKRNETVLAELRETKVINVNALDAANSHNEKILALQQQISSPRQRTERSGDVQRVSIASGAGVQTPLKVESKRRRKPK